MGLKLFELVGKDARPLSPFCWRTRYALAHKGLDAELVPMYFTTKDRIAFSGQDRVPVFVDGDKTIFDSWRIAVFLDERYPDRPPLLDGSVGLNTTRFFNIWVDTILHPKLIRTVVADISTHVADRDREHFRTTREERFGAKLEDVQADREDNANAVRALLEPVRALVRDQPYICGEEPAYADHILAGSFQWPRSISPYALLKREDPIYDWRERIFRLYDGMGNRAIGYRT